MHMEHAYKRAREDSLAEAGRFGRPYSDVAHMVSDEENGLSTEARDLLFDLLWHTLRQRAALGGAAAEDPGLFGRPFRGREEANALVAFCFRNMRLEDLHAEDFHGRITGPEMRQLMDSLAGRVTAWLELRDFFSRQSKVMRATYRLLVHGCRLAWTKKWTI